MQSGPPKILPRSKRAPLTRSQMMSRIRSRDTKPEVITRAAVQALGLRFRKHDADLPGKPDLVNRSKKWVIFVHGCFWHSHSGCKLASSPKSNLSYWDKKLQGNRERDSQKIAALSDRGYRVLIVWECDTRDSGRLTRVLSQFFRPTLR